MDHKTKILDVGEIVQQRLRDACRIKQIKAEDLAELTGLPLAEVQQCLEQPMRAHSRNLFQISTHLGIENEIGEILNL